MLIFSKLLSLVSRSLTSTGQASLAEQPAKSERPELQLTKAQMISEEEYERRQDPKYIRPDYGR